MRVGARFAHPPPRARTHARTTPRPSPCARTRTNARAGAHARSLSRTHTRARARAPGVAELVKAETSQRRSPAICCILVLAGVLAFVSLLLVLKLFGYLHI